MNKHIAKTIATLSLFVVLSVSASHVSAFPVCHGFCQQSVKYVASAPAQVVSPAPAQVVDAQSAGVGSFVFFVEMVLFFAHLI